jgi:uncharacterized protein (DUF1697 family)
MASAYVALLRGINVGGKNLVPMAELRDAFERAGYANVATYIQSGNVVFESGSAQRTLEADIEAVVEARFGVSIMVVVRSHRQLRDVVARAPDGFGEQPDTYHSDAVFLKAPLTPTAAMGAVSVRDGVDTAWPGQGVLYFQRLSARRTESRLSKIMSTPEYRLMTIRNWNTTTKLLAMLDER